MTASKPRPRVGDKRWRVEYCIEQGLADKDHPEYGGDPDKDVNRYRTAATEDEAARIAKEVYPLDQYECVRYWPEEFVAYDDDHAASHPHAGFWEVTDDVRVYEGE